MAVQSARRVSTSQENHALRRFLTIFSFLAVPLLLYSIWVLWPTLNTFFLALSKWDGYTPPESVGLANFQELFTDRAFFKSISNNLLWIVVFITVPTVGGLALAVVLNNALRFDRFLKVSYYLPMVVAPVVVALVWTWVYLPTAGLMNNVIFAILSGIKAIGFNVDPQSAFNIAWLGDPNLALLAVMGPGIWRQVGYVMILYLAGLKAVDAEVVEAARVDGAEGWNLFRYVIFPMLAPVTTIVVVISVIDSLRSFDLVNVMTKGGPFDSSQVLANYMYIKAFDDNRMGYGAAIAVVLFAISVTFIFLYLRQVMAQEDEGKA
jgi:multiple sugar transport system permease protein